MICLLDNEQHNPFQLVPQSQLTLDVLKKVSALLHCSAHHWVKHKTGEVTCDKCGCYKEILP